MSLVLGFVALALVLSASNVAAVNESMDVIVVTSVTTADIGTTITATVHVFQFGSHHDPTSLTVFTYSRVLTTTHTGTGIYEATFMVQAGDFYSGQQTLSISASAFIDALSDQGSAYVRLGPWFTVDLSVPLTHASAGQTVDVTARVKENGTLVDPSSLTLTAYLQAAGFPAADQDLTPTHVSTGTYTGSYVVPPNLAQAGTVYLGANAVVSGFSSYSSSRAVALGAPTGLSAWYHTVSAGASSGTFDLFVANGTGWPVAGAPVSGTYEYYTGGPMQSGSFSAATNASGAARFVLSYPGATCCISFRGTVTSGDTSQGFVGYAEPPDLYLVVIADPDTTVYAPGDAASLSSAFYLDGQPLTGQTVYYYAHTKGAMVASGQTATDASGRMTVSFLMPSEDVSLEFAANVGGTWYQGNGFVSSHPLSVTHNTVHAGSLLQVSVLAPPVATRYVYIYFQGRASGTNYQPAWILGSGGSGSGDVVFPTVGSLQYSLQLPRFLPKGQDYFLYVSAYPVDSSQPFYRYVDLIRIENLAPVATAVPSPSSPTVGDAITVNASSSTDADGSLVAYRYAWGDGATTDWTPNASAAHTYAAAGDYTVTVSVRDDNGAESSTTLAIRVQASTASTNVLLLVGLPLAAVAIAGVAFLLWRRSRRPPMAEASREPPQPPSPPSPPPP